MRSKCDKCEREFVITDSSIKESEFHVEPEGDIRVHWFACSHCGAKYHVITKNAELDKLIKDTFNTSSKLMMARKNHMTKKTIRKYEKMQAALTERKRELEDKLRPIGMKCLGIE